jgi:WD40 repeat protein
MVGVEGAKILLMATGRRRVAATALGLQLLLMASCGWSPQLGSASRRQGSSRLFVSSGPSHQEWHVHVFGDQPTDREIVLPFDPFLDHLDWSPDGSQVASVRDDGVYVADADGSLDELLSQKFFLYGSPAWSPDGTQIAVLWGGANEAGLIRPLIVDVATGSVEEVGGIDGGWDLIAWSPDGQEIALAGMGMSPGLFGVVVTPMVRASARSTRAMSIDSSGSTGPLTDVRSSSPTKERIPKTLTST